MPIEILMPALSPTMEEGTLAKWLVKEGDKITSGKVIAEIETDKATMEVEAVDEGTIGRILVPAGSEGVKVNAPIAVLLLEGESAGAIGASGNGQQHRASRVRPAAAARTQGRRAAIGPGPGADTSASAAVRRPSLPMGTPATASSLPRSPAAWRATPASTCRASPARARTAASSRPTSRQPPRAGPRARPAPPSQPCRTQGAGQPSALVPALADDKILQLYEKDSYEVVPHDGMRKVIAQRLTQSKQTVPHFYLSLDCRLDNLLAARERINAASPKDGPRAYKLSVNDFIIKALALALQAVPGANATWTEGGMLRHRHSDVGVAVAIEGGLFTPVIRQAELKTLSEISNEMKDLADRARKRRLAPHEYQGGTTSISNLGMFGIKSFDAVINPPHATILAVGAGEKRPVVSGDRVEVATIMSCTLSCDHRVVDGALGAELLNAFKSLIEDPVRMLV